MISIITINMEISCAQTRIQDEIKKQLTILQEHQLRNVKIKPPHFIEGLIDIYDRQGYSPFWFEDDQFNTSAYELIEVIDKIKYEGLNPKQYRYNLLLKYFNRVNLSYQDIAIADIYLTNSYILIASHFTNGLIDQESFQKNWQSIQNDIDVVNLLDVAIHENRLIESLYSFLPQSENYVMLRNKLKMYMDIKDQGGLLKFNSNRMIDMGMKGKDVLNLKERLRQTGDFLGAMDEDFGQNLKSAVINFQKRHGLKPDGVVGSNTKNALNIDVEKKIKTITVNMERLRWLPQSLGDTYILVNIADYKLKVIDNKQEILNMKVIVGQEQRSTPVFSDKISYIVLNPYWNVPRSIAVKDKLPLIKEDINYLVENNYIVRKIVNGEFVEVQPEEIEWESLSEENFNYYLRQEPGPNNALGRIKFMFPNKYSVYLHDTPSQYLFLETDRSFSSGCIRLQKPFKLADFILAKDNKLDKININKILETNKEETIYLNNHIPIHILYMTAWADEFYQIHFRPDIYNRDQKLIEAYYKQKEVEND